MLDKKSKQVLKTINKAISETGNIEKSEELLKHLPKKYSLKILDEVLWHLESMEYIECLGAENTIYSIFLTYKGENYIEFNWLKTKEFLYKSILIPVVVSSVTSLITLALTNVFNK